MYYIEKQISRIGENSFIVRHQQTLNHSDECTICEKHQSLTTMDIQAEVEWVLWELRVPNSLHGAYYIACISPEFLNCVGSDACDRLMNLLPFRSLAFAVMKVLPGTYAAIPISEDRSKELHQSQPSAREHLKQEPEQAIFKAKVHKKREPER